MMIRKAKLIAKVGVGVLALAGGYSLYMIATKTTAGRTINKSQVLTDVSDAEADHLIKVAKDIALALGTSPDSGIFDKMTENEVRAFHLISDSIDHKSYIKILYDIHTSRNLELDVRDYLRPNQIKQLNSLNYFE